MKSNRVADCFGRMALAAAAVSSLTLVLATPVHAQLGAFVQGTAATPNAAAFQSVPTARIWVDAVAPYGLDGPGDTHHPIPPDINSTWQISVSPTRRVLVAILGNQSDCNDPATITIRLYRIPRSDDPLVPLGGQQTLRCLSWYRFDDRDTTSAFRTAVFAEGPTSTVFSGHVLWWNMVTGQARQSASEYDTGIDFNVEFSPSGTMAALHYGIGSATGSRYSTVELCPSTIGNASTPGLLSQSVLHAYVEQGTPNIVVAYRPSPTGTLAGTATYNDCAVSDPLGACCLPGGGCQQTTQGGCSGTWQAGVACAAANCPDAALTVSKTGPASAFRGSTVTYSLTARNTGALASNGVSLVDRIPSGSTFVSASSGGTFDSGTQNVTWSLGTLGASGQATRTLTVRSACSGTSLTNSLYTLSGFPGGTVAGTPSVITTLTAPVTTGLSMTLISTSLAATPLQTGDRVRHTVRITNTSATVFDTLSFSVNSGNVSDIVVVTSTGGGNVTWSAGTLVWRGFVGASTSLDVTYETAIRACRSTQPSTEQLNRGFTVFLNNACTSGLASATTTQSFAVAPSPFRLAIESPSHGPVQWWGTADVNRMIACRPGATVDLDLRFTNSSTALAPASTITLVLPPELAPATDPPFVGPQPAGTSWDSGTRTISWAGQAPANDSIVIRLRVRMDLAACRAVPLARSGVGACTSLLLTELAILSVPVPPASYLLSLHNSQGLRFRDPVAGTPWQSLLCGNFESSRGFGRTPDGTIWVAGLPCFRLNPYQLSFQILPPSFTTSLGMDYPYDVAGDPRDSSLVFTGYLSGIGGRLRRYQPRTGAVSVILNNPGPQIEIGSQVVVSPDGLIGLNTSTRLLRIDPANPTAFQAFLPPGGGSVAGLTFDTDGQWLTGSMPGSAIAPRNLMSVDRNTGAFATIANMQSAFSWFMQTSGLAVLPDRDVHVGTNSNEYGFVRRDPTLLVQGIPDSLANVDLMWIGSGTTTGAPRAVGTIANELVLAPAMPNPAVDATTLRFRLPRAGFVTLEVFDSMGRRVRSLVHGVREAGEQSARWDGRDQHGDNVHAGLYFARLSVAGEARRVRFALTR